MDGNAVLVNFSSGETSPRSRGRFDAPWFQAAARKLLNWIPELTGPARYRSGFQHIRFTAGGRQGRLVSFQVNASLVYELEFTPAFGLDSAGLLRVYKNDELLSPPGTSPLGITAISISASAATITLAARISTVDDGTMPDVILNIPAGSGMDELNGRQITLSYSGSGNVYNMADATTGAFIETDNLPHQPYVSGGTVKQIWQTQTPYDTLASLENLQLAASDGTVYLVSPGYLPLVLTVGTTDNFTLATGTRTADPFASTSGNLTVSGVNLSGQPYLTISAGSFNAADQVYTISGVVGLTGLNGQQITLLQGTIGATTVYYIRRPSGAPLLGISGTYVSGGTIVPFKETPVAVAYYEGRLGYFGTTLRSDCFFLSRSPDTLTGNSRYDDFTGGSAADNACFFQIASVTGDAAVIAWAQGGPDYLFIGSFGGPVRVSGSGLDIPITPTSINVRQFDSAGCEETMAAGCSQIFFVQRAGVTLRSIKVINPYLATFESADMCLNAEQIGYSPIQRVVLQRGRPDSLWVYRADGSFCNMSVRLTAAQAETVTGWGRHQLGGGDKVVDLTVSRRSSTLDKVMVMAQRAYQGGTYCAVGIMADDVYFPDPEDVFTGGETADETTFKNILWRLSEDYMHLDQAGTYDGSARGVAAGANLALGAGWGALDASVAVSASAAIFKSTDVGAEVWKKPNALTGVGGGRGTITAVADSTHATVTITAPFDSAAAVAGDWYFAVSTVFGLWQLEGQTVAVVTDGGVYSDGGLTGSGDYPVVTVAHGSITLSSPAAVVHAGLPYLGLLQSHNLEIGGRTGPAQAKPRNIKEIYLRLMNSLGVEYGTDPYHMDKVEDRLSDDSFDRVAPAFSGIRRCPYQDSTSGADSDAEMEKTVTVMQRLPLPAVVQFIDVRYTTADE